jgi:central glycolytic genes regulator
MPLRGVEMRSLLDIQKKLLPDLLDVMRYRYRILQTIRFMQPVGRRSLAANLNITERILRSEVEFLKKQGLLHISSQGMTATEDGIAILTELEEMMKEVSGLTVLEGKIREKLDLSEVIVVPGDSDRDHWVKNEMGRACVIKLMQFFDQKQNIIAVTGGTTLAAVADMMTPVGKDKQLLFVPARGGLGEHVENQANTICATMAQRAHGQYRLLHVPDQLSEEAYDTLIQEPEVKEVLQLIHSAQGVIYGIGEAKTMAIRRRSSTELLRKIERENAVAEAFGYYFNEEGDIVHKVKTIGLQLGDLKDNNHIVAVAGGKSKATAISAYMKRSPRRVLITDEGAANELVRE